MVCHHCTIVTTKTHDCIFRLEWREIPIEAYRSRNEKENIHIYTCCVFLVVTVVIVVTERISCYSHSIIRCHHSKNLDKTSGDSGDKNKERRKTMYSREFLESLGLDPAVFDPDCEPESGEDTCTMLCAPDVLTF